MAQRVQVPKFGNWEGEGNIPYTVYFDEACKHRVSEEIRRRRGPQDNPEELSNDASPARSRKEKPVEKDFESPKFGDWDGQGGVPYTLYFDKVRKRRGSGKTRTHHNKSAGHARDDPPPAREKPVKEKPPQDLQGRRSSFIEHGKLTNDSTNQLPGSAGKLTNDSTNQLRGSAGKLTNDSTNQLRGIAVPSLEGTERKLARPSPDSKLTNESTTQLQGSATASLIGTKKMVARRSPDSKHGADISAHHPLNQALIGVRERGHPHARGNEKVVSGTGSSEICKLDETDPSAREGSSHSVSKGSAGVDHSFYSDSQTESKEKITVKSQKCCCFPWGGK